MPTQPTTEHTNEANLRPLLIDHDDSFTYILAHFLGEACGLMPKVMHHQKNSLKDIHSFKPTHIILSPGPGTVENKNDFSIGNQILKEFEGKVPILGVCLGHQGIGHYYGAKVGHAPEVKHGKKSQLKHESTGLFKGIPSPFTVMRYHSLALSHLPNVLEATAHSEDGVIMAIQHKNLPIYGVQFHPESLGSEHGKQLLKNFFTAS